MKKILLMILALFLVTSTGYCQEETLPFETIPLELTIRSDKQVYEAGEEIKLTATLTNPSDKRTIVFWNNEKPLLHHEKSGRVIAEWALVVPPGKNIETIYIEPKSIFSKSVSIENSLQPSKYKLVLKYTNPQTILGFIMNTNDRFGPDSLTSNIITIYVKEKKVLGRDEAIRIAKKAMRKQNINIDEYYIESSKEIMIDRGEFWFITFDLKEKLRQIKTRGYPMTKGGQIFIKVNKKDKEAEITWGE